METPHPKLHKPDPTDWKKALKKLADALDEFTDEDPAFCYACPARCECNYDENSDDHRCRRVILKWSRGKF